MQLPVGGAPHGVAVVDADVLALLDVDGGPDHHPAVPVEVLAGVVDAGVLQDGDVGVQTLARCRGRGNLHQLVLQKVPSEANPKVHNHEEGPY